MPRPKQKIELGSRTGAATLARRASGGTLRPDNAPIEEIWVEYKKTGGDELRNILIERYLDIVKYTAERMHMRLPSEVDVEDLMSAGLFGLMDAIDALG
jgi:DNA-directed RNA polymerase specialized sigma subunit